VFLFIPVANSEVLTLFRGLELVARHRAGADDGNTPVLDMKRSAQWARVESIRAAMGEVWTGNESDESLAKV
jgi:exocyst complex component 4